MITKTLSRTTRHQSDSVDDLLNNFYSKIVNIMDDTILRLSPTNTKYHGNNIQLYTPEKRV